MSCRTSTLHLCKYDLIEVVEVTPCSAFTLVVLLSFALEYFSSNEFTSDKNYYGQV